MTDPTIIEAAARALLADSDISIDGWLVEAEAIVAAVTPLIEAAALERAAKLIEADAEDYMMRHEVAAAIRALIPAKGQS